MKLRFFSSLNFFATLNLSDGILNTISAPKDLIPSTFILGAVSGTTTYAFVPNCVAANARAFPWLPEDAVITPFSSLSLGRDIAAFSAPLTLNELVL